MASEKRLIDANDALEKLKKVNQQLGVTMGDISVVGCNAVSVEAVMHFVERCKTVDAVEVVRCKDCVSGEKRQNLGLIRCNVMGCCGLKSDDFCSYGVRKMVNLEDVVDLEAQTSANNKAMRKVIDFMVGERTADNDDNS